MTGYRQAPEAYLIEVLPNPEQFAPLIGFYFDFHYPRTILNCQNKICFTLFTFLFIAYYVQARNIEQKITGTWTDKKERST